MVLNNASVKGTNTATWECIGTVTWVYTNRLTRELNRYRPDQTGPDQTDRHTLNLFFLSYKTQCATPRPYDCWKDEDLSFLHVLLVWWVALTILLIKKRQSWTIHQKPSLPEISGIRP